MQVEHVSEPHLMGDIELTKRQKQNLRTLLKATDDGQKVFIVGRHDIIYGLQALGLVKVMTVKDADGEVERSVKLTDKGREIAIQPATQE